MFHHLNRQNKDINVAVKAKWQPLSEIKGIKSSLIIRQHKSFSCFPLDSLTLSGHCPLHYNWFLQIYEDESAKLNQLFITSTDYKKDKIITVLKTTVISVY